MSDQNNAHILYFYSKQSRVDYWNQLEFLCSLGQKILEGRGSTEAVGLSCQC